VVGFDLDNNLLSKALLTGKINGGVGIEEMVQIASNCEFPVPPHCPHILLKNKYCWYFSEVKSLF